MTQAPPGEGLSREIAPAILRPVTGTIALPLRFHTPAGWPEPSAWWVATHQGWQPPAGWTAEPGLAPAPGGWTWWTRDARMWATLTHRIVSQYRRGIVAGLIVSLTALGLLFAPFFEHSGLRILLWGALLYGPAEIARDIMGLTTLGDRYDAHARRRAARLARRPAVEARWAEEGRWNDDDASGTERVLAAFFVPEAGPGNDAPIEQRGRILTMVIAAVFAVALIFLLADAFTGSTMGSGAR